MNKKLRLILSIVLALLTLAVGAYYLSRHRNLLTQLGNTPPLTIVWVLLLYVVMFGVLLLILDASLRICGKRLGWQENTLLNAYSLFINFFVPGQGGPAFRGIYLYRQHRLKVRNYIAATLLYYVFYGAVGVFLLALGSRPLWQTGLLGLLMVGACYVAINFYTRRAKFNPHELNANRTNVAYLLLVTILQAIVQLAIYFVELHNGNRHVGLTQAITYTGAANLALFVGLTPGAIGIRESFLIFTEHLHHISSGSIVVANVIDRSVYLVFLLLLFVLTLSLHAKDKLQLNKIKRAE